LSRSDEINFEITEWNSDDAQAGLDADYYWDRGRASGQAYDFERDGERLGTSSKLASFLSNASRYSTLKMQSEDDTAPAAPTLASPSLDTSSRRIILLEDLPNLSHLATRSSFHATLDAFLQQMDDNVTPLVIIVSESIPKLDEWGAGGTSRDYKERNESTLTVRNLIPASIRSSVGFMNIEFNAVAPTILTKALKRVLENARPSHPDFIPAPTSVMARDMIAVVIESAEGDLRNAINTLQVICMHSGSGLLEKRGTKRKANGKAESKVSKRAIAAISGKETSLVLFHALGKILYNKRVGDPNDDEDSDDEVNNTQETALEDSESLPEHWQSLVRRKSRVDCEVSFKEIVMKILSLIFFSLQTKDALAIYASRCQYTSSISASEL
jgi:cell cycle checkpoint protein